MDLDISSGNKLARMTSQHQNFKDCSVIHYHQLLTEGMRDARKLFRLFKSLVEYQKIVQIQRTKMPQHKKYLNILARAGFFFYWIFDNLQILAKIKVLEGVDKEQAGKRAATFWLIGLIFSIAATIVQMFETAQEEALVKVAIANRHMLDDQQKQVLNEKYHIVLRKKVENVLNLLKNLGDMVTASQGVGLPRMLFGFDFNDGQVGLGGLLSAVITCYQLFPEKK